MAEEKKEVGYHSDFRKTETVYSTDKDKHHETGAAFKVTKNVKDALIERGLATAEAPEGSESKKKKKGE